MLGHQLTGDHLARASMISLSNVRIAHPEELACADVPKFRQPAALPAVHSAARRDVLNPGGVEVLGGGLKAVTL